MRTSSRPGANPMVESGTPTPRTYPPHQVGGVLASATFPATVQDPSPHHLGRRKHARDPGHRGRHVPPGSLTTRLPGCIPGARSLSFTSAANSCTMSPPTRENTPPLDAGSRYGPTPAADGRADRRRRQHHASRSSNGHPPSIPATTRTPSPPPLQRRSTCADSATSTLATLPEVLTVSEAAAILRIGRNQLYQAVGRGELGAVRIGRSIRIPKHALLDLLTVTSPPAAGPPPAHGDE